MKWLQLAGKVDGYIMTLSAVYGAADPKHQAIALLVGGLAGAVGAALNSIAFFVGQPAPVAGGAK